MRNMHNKLCSMVDTLEFFTVGALLLMNNKYMCKFKSLILKFKSSTLHSVITTKGT